MPQRIMLARQILMEDAYQIQNSERYGLSKSAQSYRMSKDGSMPADSEQIYITIR